METCPKAKVICQNKFKNCPILFKPLKIAQRLAEFCQSGEISPNLVTLAGNDFWEREREENRIGGDKKELRFLH